MWKARQRKKKIEPVNTVVCIPKDVYLIENQSTLAA